MENIMAMVGSSTLMGGNGRGSSPSERVSPMLASVSPATATISPGPASSISRRRRPWVP